MARSKPIQHERNLQIHAMQAIHLLFPKVLVFAVPNGGSRHPREATNLKRMGVLPGVPDLFFFWDGNGCGAIELKSQLGTLTKPQKEVIARLSQCGVKTAVCKSLDEVINTVRGWIR